MLSKKKEEPQIAKSTEEIIREIAQDEVRIIYNNVIMPYIDQYADNEIRRILREEVGATLEEKILLKILKKALFEIKEGEYENNKN